MRYEIIFAPEAEEDLLLLRANERSEVLDAIETHLRYEPEKVSKSRIKRLKGSNGRSIGYESRYSNFLRRVLFS